MLSFLNPTRSFDPVRRCIRFAGHDGMMEVSFIVNVDVLELPEGDPVRDEAIYLQAFDKARSRIHEAARKAYGAGRKQVYELGRENFR